MRKFVAPLVLALMASLVAYPSPGSAASTLVVDDDGFASPVDCNAATPTYPTITLAIAAAAPGSTIKVCPGLYNEQVNIYKDDLTLLGEQANVDARMRASIPDPMTQSIIEHPCGPVQINANRVTLNGFTVQGSTLSDPCFLAGIWMNPGFSGKDLGSQILYNIVQDNISGIELDSTCAAIETLVQFNLIQNNSVPGNGFGNGIQTNFGLCNARIDSNKFSGHVSSSDLVVVPSSGLAVTNNELVAGTAEGFAWLFVTDSSIDGNVSTGSSSTGTIDLFGGDSGISITNNTLLNGNRAIVVENPYGVLYGVPQNFNIRANFNCITGNRGAGMEVDLGGYPVAPQLDATNNWWGSASGPNEVPRNPTATGDKIIDPQQNVDFDPWLPTDTGDPCPAAPPPPNTPGKVTGGGYINGTTGGGTTGGTTGGIGGIVPVDPVLQLAEVLILKSSNPASMNTKATFGFTITCCDPKGNLEYNDHGANVRIKATTMTNLVITSPSLACPTGKHAQFKGQANETTATGTQSVMFTVDVDDCGEPGSSPGAGPDTFEIQTSSGYMAGGPLVGGNIQIHN